MNRGQKFALMLLLAVGVALRWWGLESRGLWWDELYSVVSSSQSSSFGELWDNWMVDDSHPPGFQVFLWFWFKLAPANEFWARVPSAVAGSLTLIYGAVAFRDVLSPRGRLFWTAMVGCAYLPVYYAQEARQYALVMLGGTVLTHLGMKLWKDSSDLRTWAGFVAVCVITSYIHYYGGFLSALWIVVLARRNPLRALQATAAASVLYLPGLLRFMHLVQTGNGAWQRRESPFGFFMDLAGLIAGGPFVLVGCAVVLGALAGWAWAWSRDPDALEERLVPLVAVLVMAGVVVWCANLRVSVLHTRYYTVFLGPVSLLVAMVMADALDRLRPLAAGVGILVPVVALLGWVPEYQDYDKQGWKEASRWVSKYSRKTDVIGVLGPDGTLTAGELMRAGRIDDMFWMRNHDYFTYYLNVYKPGKPPPIRVRNARGAAPDVPGLILLAGHHLKLDRAFRDDLNQKYPVHKTHNFKSTRVYVFRE